MARSKNEKKKKVKEEKVKGPHYSLDVHDSALGVKTNFSKTENK